MNYFHILLGKPWKYDQQFLHDRRINQYNIVSNRTRQIFFPLVEALLVTIILLLKVFFMDGGKFIKYLKSDEVCYALIPHKPFQI